jgi:SAM-dependent methyltransferase
MGVLQRLYASVTAKGAPPDFRAAVGGHWDEVGQLQFDYLVKQGLKPTDRLLDVPCGSLRAGRFLIAYLDEGHYAGLDRDPALLSAGREQVLQPMGLLGKRPQTHQLELQPGPQDLRSIFPEPFDYAWAHALFDHIPHDTIEWCLRNVSQVLAPGGKLFATIFLNPHGPSFLEPMIRPRNGSLEGAVVTFPDREYWHHTLDFFHETVGRIPELRFDGCSFDYPHPLGLRMLRFVRA